MRHVCFGTLSNQSDIKLSTLAKMSSTICDLDEALSSRRIRRASVGSAAQVVACPACSTGFRFIATACLTSTHADSKAIASNARNAAPRLPASSILSTTHCCSRKWRREGGKRRSCGCDAVTRLLHLRHACSAVGCLSTHQPDAIVVSNDDAADFSSAVRIGDGRVARQNPVPAPAARYGSD